MKYLTKFLTYTLLLLTLFACDINERNPNTDEQAGILSPKPSEPQSPLTSSTASEIDNNGNIEQNSDIVLDDDLRNAINSVVQDSVQEEVEKAVEDEISKNTSK